MRVHLTRLLHSAAPAHTEDYREILRYLVEHAILKDCAEVGNCRCGDFDGNTNDEFAVLFDPAIAKIYLNV